MDLGARGGAPAPSGSPNGISTISSPKIAFNANFYVSVSAANTEKSKAVACHRNSSVPAFS
jgi:hypothetical protein